MATTADYLYFSFVTITTVGYGDFTAASGLGRALASLEALLGQVYLVTVVATIVVGHEPGCASRHTGRRARRPGDDDAGVTSASMARPASRRASGRSAGNAVVPKAARAASGALRSPPVCATLKTRSVRVRPTIDMNQRHIVVKRRRRTR